MKNFNFYLVGFSHLIFSILSFSQDNQRLNDPYGANINQPFSFSQNQLNSNSDTDREEGDVDSHPKAMWVPGEIIIKYNTTSFKEILGKEILNEYDNFRKELVNSFKENISVCKPVFGTIVNRMIEKNISEKQVKEELFYQRNSKSRGINVLGGFLQTDFSRTVLIRFDNPNLDPLKLAVEISSNDELREAGFTIEYAEPNYLYYTDYTVNDLFYDWQWSHEITKAELGWDIERGNNNIKLGIIDTGIDYLHEDLVGNYVPELSYDFVDIDTSAYKLSNLFPINGEDYTVADYDPKDFHGHGTHVAGIAGASANNGVGISGVAHHCSIISLRAGFSILNGTYEAGALEDDDISNAILYAITNGIDILNMSFGGPGSQTMNNAITSAGENGIILIAAAGNSSNSEFSYPAAYDNVISVSSTNSSDKRSNFSNYGSWIDIAAPGESIFSTVPRTGGSLSSTSGYRYLNGTSMAAPYVSGLAALLLSKNPSLTPQQVEYIIIKSSDLPKETANYIGKGRINVFEALKLETIKSSNIDAEISSPNENQFHESDIDIIGTAGGSEFILEYGYGIYPSNWTEINRGNSVQNGLLGTLNINGLASGQYTIRLNARDAANEKEVRVIARIGDTEGLHAGFPLTLNFNPGTFIVSDLDGNGTKESIVIGNSDTWSSIVYVFDSEGLIQPGWPQAFPIFYTSERSLLVADINSDGKQEIIIYGPARLQDISEYKGMVLIFNYNGTVLNGWPKRILEYRSYHEYYIAVSDIDLNGNLDIVLGSEGQLHAFNYDGTYLPGWPVEMQEPYFPRSPIVLANIDSDPQLEIITTSFHNLDPNNFPNYTYAFNYDGSVVSGFPYAQSYWGWALAGGDINNDGKVEIMTQNSPISNTGQKLPWSHTTMHSYSQFTIGNVNDDPFLEILYGDGNCKAYLSDYKGQTMPGWPIREQEFAADGSHIIADISGDDKPEIIIVWQANTSGSLNQKTGLYAYNIDGTLVQGFPKFSGIFNIDKAAVDDIDNDGFVEIIGMDFSDRKVFVWDMDKTYNPENTQWPIYQNNTWLTGVYPYNGNNIFTDFDSFSINEDDTLKIHISPNYINWSIYEVLPDADSSTIITAFDKEVLKVIPQTNWSGESRVSLSVLKEQLIDSTSFLIQVIPRNDQPTLLSNLADVSINEDDSVAVIIPDFTEYFSDVDMNDHLTFSATAVGAGLDSVKIETFSGLTGNGKTISTIKRGRIGEYANESLSEYDEILNSNKKYILKNSNPSKSFRNDFSEVFDTSEVMSLVVYPIENFHGEIKIAVKAVDDSLAEITDTLVLTVLSINDKPDISVITDQQINEDDSLGIIFNSTDVDNDELNYSALSSYGNISFRISEDTLKIFPPKDWNGDTKVTVIVTDNIENDTTEFNLSVIPVNDRPSDFKLLSPEKESIITFADDSTQADSINFSWERANDAENDSVFYSFSIHDSVKSLVLSNIRDTSLSLPYSQFTGWLNNEDSKSQWYVIAYDLIDTSNAMNGPFSLTFTEKTTGISDEKMPKEFTLYQNYPNPFNPSTKIKYNIPLRIDNAGRAEELVSLKIYDILGNEISTLVNEVKQPGYYEIEFNSGKLSSGVYFYRLQAGSFVQTKKFLLLK